MSSRKYNRSEEDIPEVSKILEGKGQTLYIHRSKPQLVTPKQVANNIQAIAKLLQENHTFLEEVNITGQDLSEAALTCFSEQLCENFYLKRLVLRGNSVSVSGVRALAEALHWNRSVELLDLSDSQVNDQAAEFISEMLETNASLKVLKLDHNKIVNCSLDKPIKLNGVLSHLSIAHNPLSPESTLALLKALSYNQGLSHLSIKGITFEGSAPIKENLSGHLTSNEAVILQLANALRHSSISSLGVELDQSAVLQLGELEKALLKYNKTLLQIDSETIDWTGELPRCLEGIRRAIKANSWLNKHETAFRAGEAEPEKDLEGAIRLKINNIIKRSQTPTESFFDVSGSFERHLKRDTSTCSISKSEPFSPRNSTSRTLCIEELNTGADPQSALTPQFTDSQAKNQFKQLPSEASTQTEIANRAYKEMSFGKEGLSALIKSEEDNAIIKYLERITNKIETVESEFSSKVLTLNQQLINLEDSHQNSLKDLREKVLAIENQETTRDSTLKNCLDQIQLMKNTYLEEKGTIEPSEKQLKWLFKALDKKVNHKIAIVASKLVGPSSERSAVNEELQQKLKRLEKRLAYLENNSSQDFSQEQTKVLIRKLEVHDERLGKLEKSSSQVSSLKKKVENLNSQVNQIQTNKGTKKLFENHLKEDRPTPSRRHHDSSPIEGLNTQRQLFSPKNRRRDWSSYVPGEAENLVMSELAERANSYKLTDSINGPLRSNLDTFNRMDNLKEETYPSQELQEFLMARGFCFGEKSKFC